MMRRFFSFQTIVFNLVIASVFLSSGIYSLFNLIHYKTILSAGLFFAGVLTALSSFVLLWAIEEVIKRKNLISGYLKKFSDCEFTKYQINDYFSSNPFFADNYNQHLLASDKNYHLREQNTFIYVVKKGKSKQVPNQLAAYQTSASENRPSYIFLRDEPSQISTLGKFFIIHEIGHTSKTQGIVNLISSVAWKIFAIQVPWLLLSQNLNMISIGLTVLYILLLVAIYPIQKKILLSQNMFTEMNADIFAVRYFYQTDKTVYEYLRNMDTLPNAPMLTAGENALRLTTLKETIDELDKSTTKPTMFVLPQRLLYVMLPFAFIIPIMGYFSREPTANIVCLLPLYLIVIFIIQVVIVGRSNQLQHEIDKTLNQDA